MIAPFVFSGGALAAASSVVASPSLWLLSLALVAAAIAIGYERRAVSVTPLALAIAAYVVWAIANTFFGAVYTPAGIFHPAFLLAGFTLGRSGNARARETALPVLVAGVVILAVWGLWQSATGQGRAAALFETPNTLASVLNLAIAPLLFRLAYRTAGRGMSATTILLLAGLTATLSRGAFIALGVGILVTLLVFAERPSRAGIVRVLGVLSAGVGLAIVLVSLRGWFATQPLPAEATLGGVVSTLPGSLASRAELYRLALAVAGDHPWLGTGYLRFRSLLEAHRAEVPSYATQNITYFVHDDYLQTLVELGVPGLVSLLALIVVPFWRARVSRESRTDLVSRYAPLAGIATMAIHALGDFPFYVPVCLLGFGMLAGQVDAATAPEPNRAPRVAAPRRLVLLVSGVVLAIVLLPPALAEGAAAYGNRSWRHADAKSAAYGFELARRLEPRDWRYHWYAGQFWYAQAQAGNAAAAPLADQAFAAAIAANAQEPRPLLSRIATQMRFAAWLEHPQAAATLRDWADRALALAPLNPAVRRDHAAALAQLSHKP